MLSVDILFTNSYIIYTCSILSRNFLYYFLFPNGFQVRFSNKRCDNAKNVWDGMAPYFYGLYVQPTHLNAKYLMPTY